MIILSRILGDEVLMLITWLKELPLEFVDTLINFCELIILCVPASAAFIYYKLKTISIWPIEQTANGVRIILHNGTNQSVFIVNIGLKKTENCDLKGMGTSFDGKAFCLKPDESKEVLVHYMKKSNRKQSFWVFVSYNHNKKKLIRVTLC